MDDYQKKMLATLRVMKVLCGIGVAANITLHPGGTPIGLRLSLGAIFIIGAWIWGLLNGLGYFNQSIPIFFLGLCRLVQAGYNLWRGKFNTLVFCILIVVDVIWLFYLLIHKSKYEYERS